MTYTIIAVIWFIGALIWVPAAYFNAKAGNGGLVVMNITCLVLYAATGVLYLLSAS